MRKPRLIMHGLEFLMDERDHTTILISLAKDAVPVDEHRLDLLRSKLRDLDNQIASDGRADAPRDSRGPKAPRVSFGWKADIRNAVRFLNFPGRMPFPISDPSLAPKRNQGPPD